MEGISRISAPIILCLEFTFALLLATYLLYKYGNFRKQNPFVTGCTLTVWFLSFVIIFLLPVDVSSVSALVCVCVCMCVLVVKLQFLVSLQIHTHAHTHTHTHTRTHTHICTHTHTHTTYSHTPHRHFTSFV